MPRYAIRLIASAITLSVGVIIMPQLSAHVRLLYARVRNSKNQCQVFSGAIDSPKW